ncbi:hypothetical protein KY343_05725, partial [Candidatus Woesearchaeota archaeon]|nr:hypothetical protein [Candidatus Woesearchaeota archaeon]
MKNKSAIWIFAIILIAIFLAKNDLMFAALTIADEDQTYCLGVMEVLEGENFDCSARRCTEGADGRYYLWCDCEEGYEFVDPGICEPIPGYVEEKECTDSDGGRTDYLNQGEIRLDGTLYAKDFCFGSTLTEWYCTDGDFEYDTYSCPYGCKDGACIQEEEEDEIFKCVDQDSGRKYDVASECTTIFPDGSEEIYRDECYYEDELHEYYCSGDPAYEGTACKMITYNCPYGCENGKCLTRSGDVPTPVTPSPIPWYQEYWWALLGGAV